VATSSPRILVTTWPYRRETVDVVRPVTSGDHAWVTYSESTWSAAEGERPRLAYVVRNTCVNFWNRVLGDGGPGRGKPSVEDHPTPVVPAKAGIQIFPD
jgi:hypothetical protein